MIENAAAKNNVEYSVVFEVPDVVVDESEIWKIQALLDEYAIRKVAAPNLDAERLGKSHPCKLHGIAAFQTGEVGDAKPAEALRIERIQAALGRKEPGSVRYLDCVGLGLAAVVEQNVVQGKRLGCATCRATIRFGRFTDRAQKNFNKPRCVVLQ